MSAPTVKSMHASLDRVEASLEELLALFEAKEKAREAMQPLWQRLLAKGSR